ncbi:probable protein phosphatase 2C T23F11.1 isoform X2 [Monomorium pharaonis]|uniref:probable protein phosphatase 2C T23F11.1 isoform X2 n=1 Tax=Monomorium pharaonis TaxID=307658 RepID=UPI00063F1C0F|nr:probable protein phosphatase 2C T23F11.1 isoform X2 [Monomorium pharaonis]
MGQTLSEPITKKKSACCRDSNYRVGSSCMQGWRIKMEDSHVHILSLPNDPGTAFFAVYDGHGGAAMAQHAGKHLHEYIIRRSEYKAGDIVEGIQQGFLELDRAMQTNAALRDEHAGTTVIALLIKDNILYSANAGDSRAVACINGQTVPLSRDHKPTLKDERKRIEAAGGFVEYKRVNGNLALSRALGDFIFKRNDHKPPQEQIVTACDGIWDVMTSEEVVQFVRTRLARDVGVEAANSTIHPEEICEELLNSCLAPDALMGTGCDNMTMILVCFLHGKPCSHLISRCQKPPSNIDDIDL